MGVQLPGVLGLQKQSAGNITFSNWKGIRVFKKKIEQNLSNSDKQVFQRARFAFVQAITTILSDPLISPNFLRRFWFRWATEKMSQTNAFNKENIPLQAEYSEITPIPFAGEFSLIRFAKGTLEGFNTLSDITYNPVNGDVSMSWVDNVSGNGLPTDKVYFGVFVQDTGMWYFSETETRVDQTLSITIPTGLTAGVGMPYFVFYFRGEAGSEVTSNSVSGDTVAV